LAALLAVGWAARRKKFQACAFCARRDSPLHKEDVLAKWFAAELPGGRTTSLIVRSGRRNQPPTRTHGARGHFALVHRQACQRCNNGWMSALEGAVKPILTPMIRGEVATLDVPAQRVIATWLVKTAMNYELVQQRTVNYFTADERRTMAHTQTTPDISAVFLARYLGTHHATHADTPLTFYVTDGPGHESSGQQAAERASGLRHEGYTFTVAVRELCLQLLMVRPHRDRGANFRVQVRGEWSAASIEIWPGRNAAVSWPPENVLDDQGRAAFEERWRSTADPAHTGGTPRWDI
jgi:hypothetical protein